MPFGVQKVNAPAHTPKNSHSRLVPITQIALNTALDLPAEHFCHQIRNVIGVILYGNLCLFEIPEEM